MRHCSAIPTRPMKIEISSPLRTPLTTPCRSMSTPPITGPITIGIRLISDCIPIPMVCFAAERLVATRENIAGSESVLHATNKNVPPITAGHRGIDRKSVEEGTSVDDGTPGVRAGRTYRAETVQQGVRDAKRLQRPAAE